MLTEPEIAKNLIKKKIEEEYSLKVISFDFIPGGECSWGYKVKTNNAAVYFLKIHTGLEEHKLRFDLLYKLFTICGITNIIYPLKTLKGELVFYFGKYPVALFNFISGKIAADKKLTTKQRFSLGELLGKIHKAKEMIGEFQLQEDFHYRKENLLLKNFKRADLLKDDASVYKKFVARLLIKNESKILARLGEMNKLGEKLKNQNLEFVICHGEPHKWNTMLNDKGEVFLIDWDDCLFAPKEKDLRMVTENAVILNGYKRVVGENSLNNEVLKFYDMEWNISEIEAWSTSVFFEKNNKIQNQHFLDQLKISLKELNEVK